MNPRLLITAGPTQEPIDEVRFLSNRSSGRLGIALAVAAAERGWPVTLLLGPVGFVDPAIRRRLGERLVRFRTAADLEARLEDLWPTHDLLIMAAAVADWRPKAPLAGKLKRRGAPPMLELESVPDLLAQLSSTTRPDQVVIGFALEAGDDMMDAARDKLQRKRLDGIVANRLATMDAAEIEATLLLPGREPMSPTPSKLSKEDFATWLIDRCGELVRERRPNS